MLNLEFRILPTISLRNTLAQSDTRDTATYTQPRLYIALKKTLKLTADKLFSCSLFLLPHTICFTFYPTAIPLSLTCLILHILSNEPTK